MSIYFFYGIHHSVEGERQKEQGNYIPLEQVDAEDKDQRESPEEPHEGDEKEKETKDKEDEKFTEPS